ncbi:C-type lectin domain family 9 member A-like isoform X1 [Hemitrygon akajei]|uniref:C-type lectin domain family 9 member A-like isoform X1 n=1 Tax=Hemitrygon akajei TaxID=2704970 RepID=UPI003BFA2BB7
MAPRPGKMPMTAQAGPHKQEANENIGITPYHKICLVSLITFVLFAIVVGLSIHEQMCSKNWVTNKDRSYYVSTFETSFEKAIQECSNRHSRLLEINSSDEALFVSHNLLDINSGFWIEKCENGNVGHSLLYKGSSESPVCSQCVRSNPCDGNWSFICERSAALFPDVPEKIQDLCQQPVEKT